MSSEILAYRVLNSANIPEQQQQLARVAIDELTCEKMKIQLKKIVSDSSASNSETSTQIKIDPTYQAQSETDYDTWYVHGYGKRGPNQSRPAYQ